MITKIVKGTREKLKFEECKNCKDWTGCIMDCINTCGKPLDALEEFNAYKALEEQGKLLKLPCRVGELFTGGVSEVLELFAERRGK